MTGKRNKDADVFPIQACANLIRHLERIANPVATYTAYIGNTAIRNRPRHADGNARVRPRPSLCDFDQSLREISQLRTSVCAPISLLLGNNESSDERMSHLNRPFFPNTKLSSDDFEPATPAFV